MECMHYGLLLWMLTAMAPDVTCMHVQIEHINEGVRKIAACHAKITANPELKEELDTCRKQYSEHLTSIRKFIGHLDLSDI